MNIPNNFNEISMQKMKADIARAGNLFYQYRACKRDVATIYDIENIRHGVVYARTPLQMNDPFDSMIGYSVEKIYDECIDMIINRVNTVMDSNKKLVIKSILKYRVIGETLSFIDALNKLKKYIFMQSLFAHVTVANLPQFIARDINRLYSKAPIEIKKYFNKDAFFVFALIIKDYQNEEIKEETIVAALKLKDILNQLEEIVINVRDDTYLPFLKDFLSKLTVTCFSASGWDNQLMWSHYADSYSGICVEYDFEKMDKFIGFMAPVKYSPVRPTISLKDLGLSEFKKDENGKLITEDLNVNAIFNALLAKNKCWSYEEEWRIINVEGEPYTPIFIEAPFVKSITLGLSLDDICKQFLWDVCQERNIECYQLVINSSDYSLGRELLTSEDFAFDKEKEERYINLLCEHTVPLGDKIAVNCNSLTDSIKEGDFEPSFMLNVLSFTLDYLSDVYFLKIAFNRFCRFTNTPVSEVAVDTKIGVAISQMESLIVESKSGIKLFENSLIGLRLMNKITSNDLSRAKKYIADIKEMYDKHYELNWYGRDLVSNEEYAQISNINDEENNT